MLVANLTESSGFDSFLTLRCVRLTHEALFYVRMGSSDSEQLFRMQGDDIERNELSDNTKLAAESVVEITAETDDLVLRLND